MLDHFVAMRRDATTAVPVPGRAHVPCVFRFRSDGEAVGTLYLEFDAPVPGIGQNQVSLQILFALESVNAFHLTRYFVGVCVMGTPLVGAPYLLNALSRDKAPDELPPLG